MPWSNIVPTIFRSRWFSLWQLDIVLLSSNMWHFMYETMNGPIRQTFRISISSSILNTNNSFTMLFMVFGGNALINEHCKFYEFFFWFFFLLPMNIEHIYFFFVCSLLFLYQRYKNKFQFLRSSESSEHWSYIMNTKCSAFISFVHLIRSYH